MSNAFISYVYENAKAVDMLYHALTSRGISVWLDRNDIDPGVRWKQAIRQAIQTGSFFIACFSKEYNERSETYMNEELIVAIEVLRLRSIDDGWFIPIMLNECEIPTRNIGGGETLKDLQRINLHNNWDVGIQKIFKVISPNGSKAETYIRNGSAKAKQADYVGAIIDYDQAIGIKSDFAIAYCHRGIAKGNMGLYSDALSDFDEALRLKPDYADAYINRGVLKGNLGQFLAEVSDYNEALHINPDNALAYYYRGIAKENMKEYDAAVIDYDKVIQLKPDLAEVYNNRGVVKRHLRQYHAAIADFDEALRINPNLVEPHYNRGLAKCNLERPEDAKQDFLIALELGKRNNNEMLRLQIEKVLHSLESQGR